MEPKDLLDQHRLPKVMADDAVALCEALGEDEWVRHLALARLDNPSSPRLRDAARALNEAKGGLLAVTDRRLIYVGLTLVGRGAIKKGNELVEIPLAEISGVRSQRGKGSGGDIRKVFTLIVSGSKLWVTIDGSEQEFIEIKPLGAAAEIETTLRATTQA